MRSIKRIIKIHEVKEFQIYCLFNNGESRIIDFKQLFESWNVKRGDLEYKIWSSLKEFKKVELIDGTLVWKNIEIRSKDADGKEITYYYDLDPIVLYEASELDDSRNFELGLLIRQARKELGMTQSELAEKSGTSKHYISRIENNKSGIEVSTLLRIVEGGLGKKLQIKIA